MTTPQPPIRLRRELLDPVKREELRASFQHYVNEYRNWVTSADTVRFLTIAADLVQPFPSNDLTRATHAEAVARLVKTETVAEFIDKIFRLEELSGLTGSEALPEPNYGATPPQSKTKKRKQAKPTQAKK